MSQLPTLSVDRYLRAAVAESTRGAYRSDLRRFIAWGGTIPAVPELVATYLSAHAADRKVATLERWKVSIGKAHTTQNLDDPTKSDLVRTVLKGIKRTHGAAQRQVTPAVKQDILSMVAAMGNKPKDKRDKALILLGFAAALRRSELIGLDVDEVQEVREGIVLSVRRSKADQEARGRKVGIPFARGTVCPVKALKEWIETSRIEFGPLFRQVTRHSQILDRRLTGHAVSLIVKERAKAAGLNPDEYSGHSLRAGLATSAAAQGIPSHKIRAQTGHKGEIMLSRYIRDGQLFMNNAAGIL